MTRWLRDLLLTAVTLGLAGAALVAGALFRLDLLAVALLLLFAIGHFCVFPDD